jgi:hypothetical protein
VTERVGGRDQVTGQVVPEPPAAERPVGDAGGPPGGVVLGGGDAGAGHAAADQPAGGIVRVGPPGTVRVDLLDQAAVRVVAVRPAPPGGVRAGGEPAALVVAELGDRAARGDRPPYPPAGGVLDPGHAAGRIGHRDAPAAAVVAGLPPGAVRPPVPDGPAELVVVERDAGQAVTERADPAGIVHCGGVPGTGRVDAGDQVSAGVVLAVPDRAGRVGDRGQPGQRVVPELPLRAAGVDQAGQVAQRVVPERPGGAERIHGGLDLAVRTVAVLAAGTGRVDDGGEPAGRGVLEAPRAAGGIASLHRLVVVAVAEGGPPAGR